MAKKAKPKKPEADDRAGEAAARGAGAGPGGLKGLVRNKLVLGGLALLLVGCGAGAFFLRGGHGAEPGAPGTAVASTDRQSAAFVDLPEMTVNLDSSDHTQYLKVQIALEVAETSLADQIKPMMPRVLDTFQTYMRELRPADLEGSAGLFRLKEELVKRVNVAVAPARIDAVLFKEMVVQ